MLAEHDKSNAEQLRIFSAQVKLMENVLRIHYGLLAATAETNSNQLEKFANLPI